MVCALELKTLIVLERKSYKMNDCSILNHFLNASYQHQRIGVDQVKILRAVRVNYN